MLCILASMMSFSIIEETVFVLAQNELELEERSVSGFHLTLNWNRAEDTQNLVWDSQVNEKKTIRLNVGYENTNAMQGYQAGELKITVPGIGSAFRGNVQEATDVAADQVDTTEKKRDWSYTYDSQNDIYTFINNNVIDEKSNFSGSFEILWEFESRDIIHGFNKILTAEMTDGQDVVKSNEVSFEFTSKKDEYMISQTAVPLNTPDGLENLEVNYKDYIWVNWEITASHQMRARGAHKMKYEISIPEDAIAAWAVESLGNPLEMYKITASTVGVNVPETSIVHPIVTIGYPKERYNGQTVYNPVQLTGVYHEETQRSVLAQCGNDLGIVLNANDYDFDYNGTLVSIDESTFSKIDYSKIFKSEMASFTLKGDINNKNSLYEMIIVDDIMDIKLKDGSFRQLKDCEYSIQAVTIPSVSSILNGNYQPVNASKYKAEIYGRKSNETSFNLIETVSIENYSQKVSLPETINGIQIKIKNIDESFKFSGFNIDTVFHLESEESIEESKKIDPTGFIRNLDGILLYEKGILINPVNKDSYKGEWKEIIAQRDLQLYGQYMQRAKADAVFYNKNGLGEVLWSSLPELNSFRNTGKDFQTEAVLKTNFQTETGSAILHQFSQYSILPKGIEVDDEHFSYNVEIDGLAFADGSQLENKLYIKERVNAEIIRNYKNSGRTYIKFDYDFRDRPLKVENSGIQTQFNIYLSSDNYLEYGESYTLSQVSIVNENGSFIPSELSGKDDGQYYGEDATLWVDINENGKSDEIITYGDSYQTIVQALSSYQELQKSVKSDFTHDKYTVSDALTLPGGMYTYKLKFKTGNSKAKNIVIYDMLEKTERSQWKGELLSVNTDYIENKLGLHPEIYYSNSLTPGKLSEYSENWTMNPKDMSQVKSIAVDFGDSVVLDNSLLYIELNMKAPEDRVHINQTAENEYQVSYTSIDLATELETENNDLISGKVQITLSDPIGDVILIKKDIENSRLLAGATFQLYDDSDHLIKENIVTDETGKASVRNLPFGNYYFIENIAPEGYQINPDKIHFTLSEKTIEVAAMNERILGSVYLKKTDENNSMLPVQGAVYSLYAINSDGSETLIRENLTTNQEGITETVENLKWGSYFFIESHEVPGYYVNSNKIEFTIGQTNASSTVIVETTDRPRPANVTLIKEELLEDGLTFSGNNVSDAVYSLYDYQDRLIKKDLVTDKNGQIKVSGLAYGSYYFKEISCSGYEVNSKKIEFELNNYESNGEQWHSQFDENGVLHCTVRTFDQRKSGSVILAKKDDYNMPVKNAIYTLYHSNGDVVAEDLTTDENGQIKIDHLNWDSYYFIETQAPEGYELNGNKIEFSINRETVESVIVKETQDQRIKGSVKLIKTDAADDTVRLQGAVYALYNIKDEIVIDNLVTNEKGEIEVNELEWGSYYFLEKAAPNGYSVSSEKLRFSVNYSNASILQELKAKNKKGTCEIKITKKIEVDDIWYTHGNPTFIFEVQGTDISSIEHTYYKTVVFNKEYVENHQQVDGSVYQEIIVSDIPVGKYTVREISSQRYEMNSLGDISANGIIKGETAEFDLSRISQGKVTFYNQKFTDEFYSHNDIQTNIIKTGKKLTSLTAKYLKEELKEEIILRGDLIVTAYYDDGSSKVLANNDYKLDKESFDSSLNGNYTVTVTYEEKGIQTKTTFNLLVSVPVNFTADLYYVLYDEQGRIAQKQLGGHYSPETGIEITDPSIEVNGAWITGYTGSSGFVNFPSKIEDIPVLGLGKEGSAVSSNRIIGLENANAINMPSTVINIENAAFYGYSSLTGEIVIPDNVQSIGDSVFYMCSGLTGGLVIPDSVEHIGTRAFGKTERLNGSLVLSQNIKEIGNYAFQNSGISGTLILPDSLNSISNYAFNGCVNLTEIKFGSTITSIGSQAFGKNTGLTGDIVLPETISNVGNGAFNGCSEVSSFTIMNANCTIFNNRTTLPDSAIIYGYENSTAQSYAETFGRTFNIINQTK